MKKETAASTMPGKREQRALTRKLAKAEFSHQKAERKVGKLRVQLTRAEVKLAKRADQISAVRALMQPPTEVAPASAVQNGALLPAADLKTAATEPSTTEHKADGKAPVSAAPGKAVKKPAQTQERKAVRVHATHRPVKSSKAAHAPMA